MRTTAISHLSPLLLPLITGDYHSKLRRMEESSQTMASLRGQEDFVRRKMVLLLRDTVLRIKSDYTRCVLMSEGQPHTFVCLTSFSLLFHRRKIVRNRIKEEKMRQQIAEARALSERMEAEALNSYDYHDGRTADMEDVEAEPVALDTTAADLVVPIGIEDRPQDEQHSVDEELVCASGVIADEELVCASGVIADEELVGASGVIADEELVDASGVIADEELVGASGVIADEELVDVSGVIADQELVGASGVIADEELVGASGVIADEEVVGASGAIADVIADEELVGFR